MEITLKYVILVLIILSVLLVFRRMKPSKVKSIQRHSSDLPDDSWSSFAEEILQNLGVFVCLINKEVLVIKTNYYEITNTPKPTEPLRLGNVLRCKNGEDAGLCGESEACKTCMIRGEIVRAFTQGVGFDNLEVPMRLYLSKERDRYLDCEVNISAKLLSKNGQPYLLLTIQDVTKYKQLERNLQHERELAQEADRQKSAFIANMSHEIRTPLNAIVGFSDLLTTATEEEKKKNYVDIIHLNYELLLQMVSDILDISKIESGSVKFVYVKENLNLIMKELEDVFCARLKSSGSPIQLTFIPSKENCYVNVDRRRIVQILSNFLTNAIKNTVDGTISFGFEEKDDLMYYYVKDTGIGIPEGDKDHIFHRFIKLDTNKQGTGLGLAICKSIVSQMNGEIGVDSQLGKGSNFWFKLPKVQATSVQDDLKINEKERHVLIAENSDMDFVLLKSLLGQKYIVQKASDGEDVVSLFLKDAPDIILMNLDLPKVSGTEALEAIRQISSSVFIVALMDPDSGQEQRELPEGFNAVLNKPVRKDQLKKVLNIVV